MSDLYYMTISLVILLVLSIILWVRLEIRTKEKREWKAIALEDATGLAAAECMIDHLKLRLSELKPGYYERSCSYCARGQKVIKILDEADEVYLDFKAKGAEICRKKYQ